MAPLGSQLQSRDQQPLELRSFYKSLSKQQIRHLKALVEETDFRYDIVANLPLELVPLVFQHLDLYQSFRCRRVSQRWNDQLSADSVVKALLQPWASTDNIKLRIPDGLPSKSVLNIQAEHQDAFRTGKPFSSVRIPHVFNVLGANTQQYDGSGGGLLAWVDRNDGCDRIPLYDLETSHVRYFVAPERESIYEIALSSTLLAAITTSARCYIWAHGTSRPPFALRLPSHCNNVYHLTEASLALVQSHPNLVEPLIYQHSQVIIWRLQYFTPGQRCELPLQAAVSQFTARLASGTSVMCAHDITIDRTQQHIFLSESIVDRAKHTNNFRFVHYDIEGKVLSENYLECPYSENNTWIIHESNTTKTEKFVELWISAQNEQQNGVSETAVTYVKYFMDRRALHSTKQKSLLHGHPWPEGVGNLMEVGLWKGIGYFEEPACDTDVQSARQLRVMDFQRGTCFEIRSATSLLQKDDEVVTYLGDEIFLIIVLLDHFLVYCFDRYRSMAGGETILRGKAGACTTAATQGGT